MQADQLASIFGLEGHKKTVGSGQLGQGAGRTSADHFGEIALAVGSKDDGGGVRLLYFPKDFGHDHSRAKDAFYRCLRPGTQFNGAPEQALVVDAVELIYLGLLAMPHHDAVLYVHEAQGTES